MSSAARSIVNQARQLPNDERLAVACEILALADGEDEDAQAHWQAEIERRAVRAVAGESEPVDWSVVEQRITSVLGGK